MTLDTRIYVYDEIDPHSVLHKMREILGATERHPIRDDGPGRWSDHHTLGHPAGIGLNAWLHIYYRPDAPLRSEDVNEGDEDDPYIKTACWLEVSVDTAYGYRDDLGRGCSDLHAGYIVQLGEWLDDQGIAWGWINEYDGKLHRDDDRYSKLTELLTSGDEAQAWFKDMVLPVIQKRMNQDG